MYGACVITSRLSRSCIWASSVASALVCAWGSPGTDAFALCVWAASTFVTFLLALDSELIAVCGITRLQRVDVALMAVCPVIIAGSCAGRVPALLCLLLIASAVMWGTWLCASRRETDEAIRKIGSAISDGSDSGCDADLACLTPRERDVCAWLARGYTMQAIAGFLGIASSTVDTHVRHVYQKLGVHSRDELHQLLENGDAPQRTPRRHHEG